MAPGEPPSGPALDEDHWRVPGHHAVHSQQKTIHTLQFIPQQGALKEGREGREGERERDYHHSYQFVAEIQVHDRAKTLDIILIHFLFFPTNGSFFYTSVGFWLLFLVTHHRVGLIQW